MKFLYTVAAYEIAKSQMHVPHGNLYFSQMPKVAAAFRQARDPRLTHAHVDGAEITLFPAEMYSTFSKRPNGGIVCRDGLDIELLSTVPDVTDRLYDVSIDLLSYLGLAKYVTSKEYRQACRNYRDEIVAGATLTPGTSYKRLMNDANEAYRQSEEIAIAAKHEPFTKVERRRVIDAVPMISFGGCWVPENALVAA